MPASTSSLPRLASPRWPGNAQCVVLVTVNFDAESVDLTETREENLYGRYSYGRYGMRAGLARLLDAFANTGTKATVFVPATDAQRHPAATHKRRCCTHRHCDGRARQRWCWRSGGSSSCCSS